MFFKLGTEIPGEVKLLVTKYIKSGAKAIHLDRAIGRDPELIIRLGKSDGSIRRECFLTGAETHQELVRSLAAPLRTRPNILYEPTKARGPRTFLGG